MRARPRVDRTPVGGGPGPVPYREHRFTTPDGFELGLYRCAPEGDRDALGRPVLLLPGVGSNRYGFGVAPGATLPEALAAAGRDAWLLDFRGSRSSRWTGAGRPPVSIDHKLVLDLPSAIAEVRRLTGAAALDLVGHSLGGLLVYLLLGGPAAPAIGRAVTVCTPARAADFAGPAAALLRAPARALSPVAARLPGLMVDRLARLPGPLPHLAAFRQHILVGSMDAALRRAYFAHGVEDMPGGDLAQIMRWIAHDGLVDAAGQRYDERLPAVTRPLLVLAASRDGLIPVPAVQAAFERLGSRDKDLRIVGRRHGASRDYAHADVLLAPSAARDVYGPIVEFLAG